MVTQQIGSVNTNWTDPKNNQSNPDSALHTPGKTIYTANAGGSTSTLVGAAPASGANAVRVGDKGIIVKADGTPRDGYKVVRVTAVNAGGTTVTFSPAIGSATVSGDLLKSTGMSDFSDNDSLDARLLAIGGVYTQAYIDSMTQNDKVFAIRSNDDSLFIK